MKIGEAAQVSVPAVKFEANLPIAEIFPISAPGSRTFKVRTGRLQNPALMPGMFARLMLPLGHSRGILIPQAAVATVGQLTMVQVAADQTAQLRQVKLGRQIGDQVEVLAGLKAGDRIMVPGIANRAAHGRPFSFPSSCLGTQLPAKLRLADPKWGGTPLPERSRASQPERFPSRSLGTRNKSGSAHNAYG